MLLEIAKRRLRRPAWAARACRQIQPGDIAGIAPQHGMRGMQWAFAGAPQFECGSDTPKKFHGHDAANDRCHSDDDVLKQFVHRA
jgi:hypothetical protein